MMGTNMGAEPVGPRGASQYDRVPTRSKTSAKTVSFDPKRFQKFDQ